MKLHVLSVGKLPAGPERDIESRYLARIGWPVQVSELASLPPSPVGVVSVVLDETGENLSSVELSAHLGRWRDLGKREGRFLIGGADGHNDATRARADLLLSFGAATWPHRLVRAMLAEQLYRATSILAGHPYHREG